MVFGIMPESCSASTRNGVRLQPGILFGLPRNTHPLCVRRHRPGDDSYHKFGPRRFAEVHRLNIWAIAARLSAKPFIKVESGSFVGRFGDQEYELGSIRAGLARAIRRLSELRRESEAEVA